MTKRKTTKRKIVKRKSSKRYPELSKILIFACMILVALYAYRFVTYEIKTVKETPRSEVKRVPEDVKNNLNPDFSPAYRVPILMYHYVENVKDQKDTIRKSLNINPDIFEAQVKTLRDSGYTFLTARELGDIIDGTNKMPKKAVVITVDDGHFDNATVILPILRKYNAKATFYIIPDFINGPDFLTDAQMHEIIESNLVEIGAHTVHHISLRAKIAPVVQYEVIQSKKMLEDRYGIRVNSFAYPNGDFDQQAIEAVKSAGFTTAVSTVPGIEESAQNRFFLFRLRPGYKTGAELLNYFKQEEFKPYGQ